MLNKELRNILEKEINKAREIAEDAAVVVINQLGVGESAPYKYLSDSEKVIRRRLRAHGRYLGDNYYDSKKQATSNLIEEVAYHHWHRMLFARFLAENHLLMYPDPDMPVSITLEDCEDLALEEGVSNGWVLASQYAATMLPQIFRIDSPIFELDFPPENQAKLEEIVKNLPSEIFTCDDSLGWVYQFWQSKKKNDINKSEIKIGEDELAPVTQLFTEPYMVSFILDNSLGAWWASKKLKNIDTSSCQIEEDVRSLIATNEIPLTYLRFVKESTGKWQVASKNINNWPENINDIKVFDPCCGSGHFLIGAFLILVPIRMDLEGSTETEAIDSILSKNLYGLELDQRCVEIAAFSLALNAWKYPNSGNYRNLPELNIACSGGTISNKTKNWLKKLEGQNLQPDYKYEHIYNKLKVAPLLGSLINVKNKVLNESLFEINNDDFEKVVNTLVLSEDKNIAPDTSVYAQGILKASKILSQEYTLIITNVPYLVRGKHNEELKSYLDTQFPLGKHDLAYAFLQRCLEFTAPYGSVDIVLPENWLYINPCKSLRKWIIGDTSLNYVARLGTGAFQTISGEVVKAMLLSITTDKPSSSSEFIGIDAIKDQTINAKEQTLQNGVLNFCNQNQQLNNPDYRISTTSLDTDSLLSSYANGFHGQGTFDKSCYVLQFWEIPSIENGWVLQQTTPSNREPSDYGASQIFRWENGTGMLYDFIQQKKATGYSSGKWRAGVNIWGSKGVAISGMGYLYIRPYLGKGFDENIAVIHPNNEDDLSSIQKYLNSEEFLAQLRMIDNNLKASCNTLVKVPFDKEKWENHYDENTYLLFSQTYSDNPTQWVFHGHPAFSNDPLQVAIARISGYKWPLELDKEILVSTEALDLLECLQEFSHLENSDGVLCIPALLGERSLADKLFESIKAYYGANWDADVLPRLLRVNNSNDLEDYLRNRFFNAHFKKFNNRPFIWQIWDGLNDGFSILINYHKLNKKLLERITYTYLGEWIKIQKNNISANMDGSTEKLNAAENLQKRLELILRGDAPYDIFVRWKPLERQSIGWQPDLNDGVRFNIRPFMQGPDIHIKGAGILRSKPNIKWTKDRGKDVASSPWFHLHEGERINDHHINLEQKYMYGEENYE